jgi:hypothetical protein
MPASPRRFCFAASGPIGVQPIVVVGSANLADHQLVQQRLEKRVEHRSLVRATSSGTSIAHYRRTFIALPCWQAHDHF